MMKKKISVISVLFVVAILTAACSPAPAAEAPAVEVDSVQADLNIEEESLPAENTALASPDLPDYPDWYSAQLSDVNSGEVFTISENIGKVYLVETMAIWCSNCLRQQQEVKRFHDLLGERDDFESIGINIDPNEDTALLTGYVQKNGFDWIYVVASNELIDEISALYGSQFLNPPSAPMLIIDRQGNPHPLGFGIKSAEELLEAVTPYL
jgi:hypothetical protein